MNFKKFLKIIYNPFLFFSLLGLLYGFKAYLLLKNYPGSEMASYLSEYYQDKSGIGNYFSFLYFTIGFAYYIHAFVKIFQKKFKNLSLSVVVFVSVFTFFYYLTDKFYFFFINNELLLGVILIDVVILFNLGFLWEITYLTAHVVLNKFKKLKKKG